MSEFAKREAINRMQAILGAVTAPELATMSKQVASIGLATTPATGSCAVQFTLKDAAGNAMAYPVSGVAYVGTVSTGLTSAAGTSVATLTNGEVLTIVTGRLFNFITTAAGLVGLTLTASAGTYYVTIVLDNGRLLTSGAIVVN